MDVFLTADMIIIIMLFACELEQAGSKYTFTVVFFLYLRTEHTYIVGQY